MQSHNKHLRVSFGQFVADLRSGELHCEGRKIHLQDQPFQVLSVLLERAGELVTREELRNQVWPSNTFLEFDHALNTAIKKIRIALSDDAVAPRYIQTIPKRGYRWIAPVTFGAAASAEPATAPSKESHGKHNSFGWGIVRSVLAWSWVSPLAVAPPVTIAITLEPIASADRELQLLYAGISLQLAGRLAEVGRIKIVESRVPAGELPLWEDAKSTADRNMSFRYIVRVSLRADPKRIRMDVDLTRGEDHTRIWSGTFDHERGDPLRMEADLAHEVALHLVRFLPDSAT